MLKQGVVQETLAELNTASGVLPPLHNLPHWSRVNNFDKARYPKPFLKDRIQPLPNPSEVEGMVAISTQSMLVPDSEYTEDASVEVARGSNPAQRVVHLERSIQFLQQQHQEVLHNLHEEIDLLKRHNKELQFQIVMIQRSPSIPGSANSRKSASRSQVQSATKASRNGVVPSTKSSIPRVPHPPSAHKPGANANVRASSTELHSHASDEKTEELKVIFLEEEIKDLKKALREERNTNQYLQQLLDTAQKQVSDQSIPPAAHIVEQNSHSAKQVSSTHHSAVPSQSSAPVMEKTSSPATKLHPTPPHTASHAQEPLPFNAKLNPLRIHTSHAVERVPNVEECEMIIKHLQRLNDSQAHELNQLKSDLRDVLYSHKWTPDAYLLAKAYVVEDDAREMAEQSRLPRIAFRQNTRKLPDVAYLQKDAVSLPALKQKLGNKAIERKKRAQILQKSRLNLTNKEVAN